MSRVGHHVRQARRARGLRPQALAALLGYRNLDKGARRIAALETTGVSRPRLLAELVVALGLEPDEIERLAALDRHDAAAAFEAWRAEPTEPELFLLPLLAVRVSVPIPHDVRLDRDKTAEYALGLARERGCRAAVRWDRQWTYWVWFRRDAERVHTGELEGGWIETRPEALNEPHARLRARRIALTIEQR